MFFFFFNDNIQIKLGASPKEANVAIVSINSGGTVGELNKFVLYEFGYDESILKQLNLGKGFDLFQLNGKAILFIVTVGSGNPINNLNQNLKKGIEFYLHTLTNKKIWIPLMATGAGNLSYLDSYKITIKVLEELKTRILNDNCQFIISIPNDEEGKALYKQIETEGIDSTKNNDPKEVNNVIEHLNANYYFVGIDWNGKKQTNRFYNQGIWETGYDDRLTGVLKNILVDDILIIKEPYAIKNESNTKIIAIGKVLENPMNGTSVKVDWIIKNLSFEIEAIGYNSSTITTAHLDSVKEIFSKINPKDLQKIKSSLVLRKKVESENKDPEKINKPYRKILSGILGDSETGEDYLDIKKDVEAFARVIAAKSFEPPLAIALLGKWGSGKSFFMHKLKEDIQKLSKSNPQNAFCEGIAHVHFNAWSYMDANLWASFVTRIFEGLEDYIKNSGASEYEKKKIEEELFQKLFISKEELTELNGQKVKVEGKIKELIVKKDAAEIELNKKINSIRISTLKELLIKVDEEFEVQKQIENTLNNNPTFVNSLTKFEKIVPKKYWDNPTEFYNQLKSGYTFIKAFFYRNKWKTNLLWVITIIAIVVFTPIITYIINLLLSWNDFTITDKQWVLISLYGATFTRGIDTFLKIKKQIAPFWAIKEDYEAKKENAVFKFNQEEKALQLEIKNSREEIIQLNNQIAINEEVKANLEFKLKNALTTEALYSFIERRANSDDYKKHLGIISLIRKDLEILSGLLTGHKTELVTNAESEEFKNMFKDKRSLERIILYIDDLDRCPEERVVEVLEAVNLLMAFPLFVVVVGVDPRWVKNALIKKHHIQFTGHIGKVESKEIEVIEASSYLEKIFQVPFHLKDASDLSIKHMIKTLAQGKPNIISPKVESSLIIENNRKPEIFDESMDLSSNSNLQIDPIYTEAELFNKESIEALNISEKEIELLQDMSQIIGNNPRAIKRFVNIYRIVKTHEDFGYNNQETKESELAIVMFILALSMGKYKILVKSFEYFLARKLTMEFETLDHYLSPYTIKNDDLLLDKRSEVYGILLDNSDLLNQNITVLSSHYQFIKRFTFKNI